MVTLPVVCWSFKVTCQNLPTGLTPRWVCHAVPDRPSIAMSAECPGSSGTPVTDATPWYCAVDCADGGASGKMSSATLGLGSDAAKVMPALADTVFHRNDC